ncbi:hypothetical protein WA026_016272 [Henosepilachna vigintioctopunctata]|uniref:Uncharacterized protein n=1 Tax=Henosepilachna vigintioctopunctata TaxID=420089 RepID=A0AAW1UCN2_9CUCU
MEAESMNFRNDEEAMIPVPDGVVFEGYVGKRFAQTCAPKSRLQFTENKDHITKTTYDFPLLSSKDERIKEAPFSPLYEGIKHHGLVVRLFPQNVLDMCFRSYRDKLVALLKPARAQINKLNWEQAIC